MTTDPREKLDVTSYGYTFPYRGYIVTVFYALAGPKGPELAYADAVHRPTNRGFRVPGALNLADAANGAVNTIDEISVGERPRYTIDV